MPSSTTASQSLGTLLSNALDPTVGSNLAEKWLPLVTIVLAAVFAILMALGYDGTSGPQGAFVLALFYAGGYYLRHMGGD